MTFVEIDAFTIMGIEARTSFQREKNPGGVIPGLWARFLSDALPAIPNRRDGDLVALYTDSLLSKTI
jgi:predicted transcriptional regulator YdeE